MFIEARGGLWILMGKGTILAVLVKKIGHTFPILIHTNDYILTYITIYSYQLISIGGQFIHKHL